MIIWSGFGFLSVLIVMVGVGLGVAMTGAGMPDNIGLSVGLLVAAVGNWFAGKWLNDPSRGRELIDAKTGQRVIYRPNHSLFFIPMQWWSVVAVIGAVIVLFAPPAKAPLRKAAVDAPIERAG